QINVLRERDLVLQDTMRANVSTRAYDDALTDHAGRTNVCSRVDSRALGDDRRGVHTGRPMRPRVQHSGDASVGRVRVLADQRGSGTLNGGGLVQYNCTGSRLRQLRLVTGVSKKR